MPDVLIRGASQILTFATGGRPKRGAAMADPGCVGGGAIAVRDGVIAAVGGEVEARRALAPGDPELIEAAGMIALPGFVDPHTHLVFAGERAREFEARLLGADFLATLHAGGGILTTAAATRAVDDQRLIALVRDRLRRLLGLGMTTVEVKSGYGLSVGEELRQLELLREAAASSPLRVVPTLLALHARPPEYRDDPEGWVGLVGDELIPTVASRGLATACDVFVQPGVFSLDQCRRVLAIGRRHGLAGRVHADQLGWTGGAELAAEAGARSADHLGHVGEAGIRALAASGTVAVLIPGSTLFVPGEVPAPARAMIEAGVTVAISTDFNPGSSPISSPALAIGLSCALYRLSAAEALAAATINAACAVGLAHEVGSIEVGKRADLVLIEADDYREIPYRFGENLVRHVVVEGRPVVSRAAVGPL